jgi:hypothetical protein
VPDARRSGSALDPASEPGLPLDPEMEPVQDDEVCFHEGGDMFAEEVEKQMAILPEVISTTEEVTIEDIQVGDPGTNTRKCTRGEDEILGTIAASITPRVTGVTRTLCFEEALTR